MINQKENRGTCVHFEPEEKGSVVGRCLANPMPYTDLNSDLAKFRITVRGRPSDTCDKYEPALERTNAHD